MLLEKQQNKQAFINWLQLFMNGMTNGGTYAAHFMAAASIKSKQLEFLKWKQPSAPSKYNCNQRPMQFKHRQILQHHSTICLEINISSHDYYSRPIDFILLYQVKSKLPSAYIVKQHRSSKNQNTTIYCTVAITPKKWLTGKIQRNKKGIIFLEGNIINSPTHCNNQSEISEWI